MFAESREEPNELPAEMWAAHFIYKTLDLSTGRQAIRLMTASLFQDYSLLRALALSE
jgi:hypothetical protein